MLELATSLEKHFAAKKPLTPEVAQAVFHKGWLEPWLERNAHRLGETPE
jgi:hypothetical protein